jgi:threonine-phosphate decarboxylase
MGLIPHGGDIFAVARAHGWDWRDVLDFSASINPLGPSPRVAPAICQALDRIVHYPEREPSRLRRALAETWGLDEDGILLGNGATELIYFAARMFAAPMFAAGPVTLALPVFREFRRAFPAARTAALTDCATWPREGLVIVTRPANPTGWTLPVETLRGYLSSCGAHVLADESFIEFSASSSAVGLIEEYPRLAILRSLTKFYALPGLRVGALIGSPAAVRSWREQREPWQVNVLAEEAALAALGDRAHASRTLDFLRGERAWLFDVVRGIAGVEPHLSDANFLYVSLAYPAVALCEHLLRRKILIRDCAGWPGAAAGPRVEAVRIAVRTRAENERLLEAWREFHCD